MRFAYTLSDEVEDNPVATALFDGPVERSLKHRSWIADMVLKTVQWEERVKADGTTEPHPTFEMDIQRLARVYSKMVRGLHFFEFGERLPADYEIHVHFNPKVDVMRQVSRLAGGVASTTGAKTLGGDIVAYKGGRLFPGHQDAYWGIVMFRKIGVYARAVRPGFDAMCREQFVSLAGGTA